MFQLSFLNTGLLIFAAATILPLVIWLLAKRKPKRIVFPSLRFIKLSKDQDKKRTKLKNILLLIIRMLIILLTVLAIARPMLRIPGAKPGKKHPPTAIAIILDTSYSMDYTTGTKSLLDHAKTAILEINRLSTYNDRLILISSDPDWNRLHSQIYAEDIPNDLIRQIQICHQPAPMEDLINLAIRKLADTKMPNREIYLLTDRQNQPYPAKPELPIHLVPLPQPDSYGNLACSDAKPIPQLVQKSRSQMIEFKLSNYGDQERKEVLVKAVVNDIKLAEKFISIPARQTLTESILIELQQDGWQKGYIEVMDDRLSPDNRAYFAFPFYLSPRIAVISESSSLPPALASVISVYKGTGTLTMMHPLSVNSAALDTYNLIIVQQVSSLNQKLSEILQEASTNGKGILYNPGRQISADYKAFLNRSFGINLGDYGTGEKSIDFVNRHHYISTLVAGKDNPYNRISDYHSARATSAANTILSASGDAVMLASDGAVLCLMDLSSLRNRFLLDPAFPVLMIRSLQFLDNGSPELSKLTLGDRITASSITLPDGKRIDLANRSLTLTEPGLYIKHGSSDQTVAVDPDYLEGDYKPLEIKANKYYKFLGSNWKEQIFYSRLGNELWKYLLIAALILIILEIILVKLEEARPVRTDSRE